MTVYVVVDNEVHQPEEYAKYLALITPTVADYGGEYVIRAGEILLADSDWQPDRLVVMAFPDARSAKAWVESEEVRPIHAMRRKYATSKLIVIEGVKNVKS